MGYSLDIRQEDEYLHVIVEGDNTLTNVLSYFEEVYGACILYRCSNVLIEQHFTGPSLDTFDIFVVITKNYNKALTLGIRLAFADMNINHDTHRLKFAENLANIRGVNVRVFYERNIQEMIDWLCKKKNGGAVIF